MELQSQCLNSPDLFRQQEIDRIVQGILGVDQNSLIQLGLLLSEKDFSSIQAQSTCAHTTTHVQS